MTLPRITHPLFFGLFFMIFSQCKNTLEHLTDYIDSDPENVVKEVERTSSAAQNESINSPQVKVEELEREPNTLGMIGMYVGRFDNNMINITIESVEDGRVYGRSICAGNDRPLSGTYIYEGGNKFYLDLQEPGDDKYDGVFRAVVDLSISSMSGTWSPYNPSAASSKTFDIPKRTYRYDPNVGIWPETSRRELMYDELWEYTEEELNLMRNEIFARHGHSFKNIDLRRHFESQPWYIPIDDEVSDRLSRIERENVRFIKEAEDSYDEFFGR